MNLTHRTGSAIHHHPHGEADDERADACAHTGCSSCLVDLEHAGPSRQPLPSRASHRAALPRPRAPRYPFVPP